MGFEERAQGWLAWTRTPDHDAYWRYRDAFFALVPQPGTATLQVGCGEGRGARGPAGARPPAPRPGARGGRRPRVPAPGGPPTLVSAAAQADPASGYVVGLAEALPFDDGAFE